MNLENRIARCTCGREEKSAPELAFFEYRGAESSAASTSCGICRFHAVAHTRARELNEPHLSRCRDHEFVPFGSFEHDVFYCGCRGWN